MVTAFPYPLTPLLGPAKTVVWPLTLTKTVAWPLTFALPPLTSAFV